MRRRLLALPTLLLLALPLTACDDDEGGAARSATSKEPEDATQDATQDGATESPSEDATEDGSAPSPGATVTDAPAGAGVDGCAVVSEELLTSDLGFAADAEMFSQASSFADPASKDCYYSAGTGDVIVVKATSRPDTDMPEASYGYGSLPGAEKIDGVDWGWIYVLSPSPTVASVVFAQGDVGLDLAISTTTEVTMEQLQSFAADVVEGLPR